jgi:hypothetical protein
LSRAASSSAIDRPVTVSTRSDISSGPPKGGPYDTPEGGLHTANVAEKQKTPLQPVG